MVYIAFIFALALACVAGMEFISLMALDTRVRQLKRRVKELEADNARLSEELINAEALLTTPAEDEEELWPELIDDNSTR